MILHVVLFRFRNGVTPERCQEAVRELRALGAQTALPLWWSILEQGRPHPQHGSFTKKGAVVELAVFWGFTQLDQFRDHPEHRRVRDDFLAKIADWEVVDAAFSVRSREVWRFLRLLASAFFHRA